MSGNPGIFDFPQAKQYLQSIGRLGQARAKFCPANHNDRSRVWQIYVINLANAFKYHLDGGAWYQVSCRGQRLDMPGMHQAIWRPDRKGPMHIHEWPGGPDWKQGGPAFGRQAKWWYDPRKVRNPGW